MSLIKYRRNEAESPVAWNPFEELRREIDRAFGAIDATTPGLSWSGGWKPAVNVREEECGYEVTVELPGLKKEDIQISTEADVLTVSGERKEECEAKEGARVIRSERVYGRFERSLSFPKKFNAEKIAATYKDGILTVSVPKAEESKPKQIKVNVG